MRKLSQNIRSEIVHRYKAGEATKDLCSAFGCSDTTVRNMLRERGVQPSRSPAQMPLSQTQRYDIFKLYLGGMKASDVAKEVGCAAQTVPGILRKLSVKGNSAKMHRKLSSEERKEMATLYEMGETYAVLGAKYGVVSGTIRNNLKSMGVTLRIG